MKNKLKNILILVAGVAIGVGLSMQLSATAQKKPTAAPLPLEELRTLSEVFGLIKSDYVEPVDDKKLLIEAVSGMVSSLDPHSAYLDKKAIEELKESTKGEFVGLGIEVGMEDGFVKVISPIEDTPAFRAGVKAGDLITRIDDTPVKGMTLDEAVKRMRGQPKTKIVLTISRKDEDKPVVITIEREKIKVKSVKGKIIEPGYAWLRVAQFQDPTVSDLAKKINELYKQDPKIKGLILDLRNDPGGVLPGAIGVSAAFLPKGVVVVTTDGQLKESKAKFYARSDQYTHRGEIDPLLDLPEAVKTVPMVVLVNVGSASASEIVAGALQDYKRATILGTQTFGKGSVQTIKQISPTSAIKLTTARYYTPKGHSIQAKGITPDLLVEETPEGDGINALRVREADLQKHLTNDKDKNAEDSRKRDEAEEAKALSNLEKKKIKRLEYGGKDDFQLQQAINHLKGLPVKTAKKKAEKTEKNKKDDKDKKEDKDKK